MDKSVINRQGEEPTFKNGRKFAVVVMASVALIAGMAAGIVAAWRGVDLPWLAVVLPILAGTLPVYIGGNAYQRGVEIKQR